MLTHEADDDYERGQQLIAAGRAVALASVVVMPAQDEERQIGECLRALAAQTVSADCFETILVARRLPR